MVWLVFIFTNERREEIKHGLSKYVTSAKSYGAIETAEKRGKFKVALIRFF